MFVQSTTSALRTPAIRTLFGLIWARYTQMHALRRTRNDLARLTSAQLEDVGISPRDARIEAEKPFWDAPAHWMR